MALTNHDTVKVIRLYEGIAPGSEEWDYNEQYTDVPFPMTYNVSTPTLTAYLPHPDKATGAAVIICPGGGFFILATKSEGNDVAHWLNQKGIAAFVLKYRLGHLQTDNPLQEAKEKMMQPGFGEKMDQLIPFALADGREAISYLRCNAGKYNIAPNRIGTLGFSAGTAISAAAAVNYTPDNRPDFAAAIYGYIPSVVDAAVPVDAPPLFLAAANDDPLGLAPKAAELYLKWAAAKKQAELHIYQQGGHGFGMHQQNIPTDNWIERFYEWLALLGMLTV